MDAVKTGALIRKCRTEKNFTQKQLAEMINVSAYAVSKWENGRGMPDISLLESLAHALDLSISELVMGEENTMTQNKDESLQRLIDTAKKQEKRKTLITVIVTALAVCVLGFAGWYGSSWYLHTKKIPVRYTETDYDGENGTVIQRNIWIEEQYNNYFFKYFGSFTSLKSFWTYVNEDGEGEMLFFLRTDKSSQKEREEYERCLTENGMYLPVEKGTILAKVWYYNGDDKTITEIINDNYDEEREQRTTEYIFEHWNELTADSVLLYDNEHPEQIKRHFSYPNE